MSYEHLSRVYDSLMYDAPAEDWGRCLLNLMKRGRQRVLEYACGTGRVTEHLLRAGMDVVAIDSSAEMLNMASEKLRPLGLPVQLVQARMEDFSMPERADSAVCACDGVNYLLERSTLGAFFRNVYANLVPGGRFIFDITSEYKLEHILADNFFYDDGDTETVFWQSEFHAATRICELDVTVFVRAGECYERFDEHHTQRAWRQDELLAELRKAGFHAARTFDFGTSDPPGPSSERILFCAEKEPSI